LFSHGQFAAAALESSALAEENQSDGAARGQRALWRRGVRYEDYKRLRMIVRPLTGHAKALPYAARDLPVGTREAVARREIIRELEDHLHQLGREETIPWLLTSYALRLAIHGTPRQTVVDDQTIYNYVVGAGGITIRVHPRATLAQLEADDALDVYQDVVNATKRKYKPHVAKYLSYFHGYLVREHDAVAVDLRGTGGYLTGCRMSRWLRRASTRQHSGRSPDGSNTMESVRSQRFVRHPTSWPCVMPAACAAAKQYCDSNES
jgi:hypothetical protein